MLFILTILLSTQAFAQEYSRELLFKAGHEQEFKSYLGDTCFKDLQSFYRKGKRLVSKYLIDQSFPLSKLSETDSDLERVRKNITKSPKGYYTLYHYTTAETLASDFEPHKSNRDEVFPKLKHTVFPSMMAFIKNPSRSPYFDPDYLRVNKGFLYVSSCPTCSSNFGHIQLSFTFSPDTRVITVPQWHLVENDLERTFPEVFGSCRFKNMGLFALEDSDIDLINYDDKWHQLTNMSKVVNADVLIFPSRNYSDADEETMRRAQRRIYGLKVSVTGKKNEVPAPQEGPEEQEELAISVIEATWITKNDSLSNAKKFCDGKESCSYMVHERFLSGVKYNPNKPKPFKISWKCTKKGKEKVHTIDADARGETFTLACE